VARAPRFGSAAATALVQDLAELPGIEAVCLFGSAARGDLTPTSDVDLLILSSDGAGDNVFNWRPRGPTTSRITLANYTVSSLDRVLDRKATFGVHLRMEGKILFDRRRNLDRILAKRRSTTAVAKIEIADLRRSLAVFYDLGMFNGNFLICLGRLYSTGRSLAMANLMRGGQAEFNTDRAFAAFSAKWPSLKPDVAVVEQLRPFYLLVTGRPRVPLPFPYVNTRPQTARAVSAVRRIGAA
jgi:predicted nucleotidyltransferase